jgi:hypothetical protein
VFLAFPAFIGTIEQIQLRGLHVVGLLQFCQEPRILVHGLFAEAFL